MVASAASEHARLLDRARALLGDGDDALLEEANLVVNEALLLRPDSVEGWLVKCQVASAAGDPHAALAAVEMAARRTPRRAEVDYWRGAVLGDLGHHDEALAAIEAAFAALTADDDWLLEDLYFEQVTLLGCLGLGEAAARACEAGLARCPGSALLRSAWTPTERARVRAGLKVLRGGAT